jgi:hypothetical protein
MELAAGTLTQRSGHTLLLLSECTVSDAIGQDEELRSLGRNYTGLFLNSLLVPTASKDVFEEQKIFFKHRAYQEFFLARYIHKHADEFNDLELPEAVNAHLNDILADQIRST